MTWRTIRHELRRLRGVPARHAFCANGGGGVVAATSMGAAAVPLPAQCLPVALSSKSTSPCPRYLSSSLGSLGSGRPSSPSVLPPARQPPHGASVSRGSQGAAPQLVRDFIHDSLYHPTEGYFSKQTAPGASVVGSLAVPLDFRRMAGQQQYLVAVREQYRKLQASWLTPVEIFQPHYGRAIGACILQRWRQLACQAQQAPQQGQQTVGVAAEQQHSGQQQQQGAQQQFGPQHRGRQGAAAAPPACTPPLLIYEVGGGTGTLALSILDWLRDDHPDAYRSCRYRCIEISPVLAELQHRRVAEEGGHAAAFAVRQHDAADAAAWGAADEAEEEDVVMETAAAAESKVHASVRAAGRMEARGLSSGGSSRQRSSTISRGSRADPSGQAGSAGSPRRTTGSGTISDTTNQPCFIIMCEVLDNLPHDRVQRDAVSGRWRQTLVAASDTSHGVPQNQIEGWEEAGQQLPHPPFASRGQLVEVLQPARDPLILRCLEALEAGGHDASSRGCDSGGGGVSGGSSSNVTAVSAAGSASGAGSATGRGGGLAQWVAHAWRRLLGEAVGAGEVRWLPTGCLQLLDTLHKVRTNHTLIAADFSQLPEIVVAGVNAPLVATTVGGTTVDHGTYLVPRGTADIFFPTDFALLCTLYRQAAAARRHRFKLSNINSSNGGDRGVGMGRSAAPEGSAIAALAGATATEAHKVEGPQAATAEHMCTADFMQRYSPDLTATATRSGYNPLCEDYTNTAFFIGSSNSG